jgi:hypothetical protein
VEVFDQKIYGTEGEDWLLNVMLVETKPEPEQEDELAKRVSVGQIHSAAWNAVKPGRKKIRLA